jgi:hypothetical protein
MPLHIVKLAVGVSDLAELRAVQLERRKERGFYAFYTRNLPRRQDEVLDDGSIYWVIKGYIQARQRIMGFVPILNKEGAPRHLVKISAKPIPTEMFPYRAFQGWRYLEPKDAPPDRLPGRKPDSEMPAAMMQELRELGLL